MFHDDQSDKKLRTSVPADANKGTGTILPTLITDTISIALAAKPKSERVFLVTDAMATVGPEIEQFKLNDRDIVRNNNRLTLAGGNPAGADLNMSKAVSVTLKALLNV